MWSAPNRLVSTRVDEALGLVAVTTFGKSPSAGRVLLLDLNDGSVISSRYVPGSPHGSRFVGGRLVVGGKKRVHVFELDKELTEAHRFVKTGSHRSLAQVGPDLLVGLCYHDAIFFDLDSYETTKRRPGRWLKLLHAPFGPLVLTDDGRLLLPNPDHTFSEFAHVGSRPALSWLDNHGRLWISRDRPTDLGYGAGQHLDVFDVTADGIALGWSREMDPDSVFFGRNDGLWLNSRNRGFVCPTADGDIEVGEAPMLDHLLTSDAHPNFNIISYETGSLSLNSDNESFVARLA